MDSDSNEPHPGHVAEVCVHILSSTPDDMIVAVTLRGFSVYRLSPLSYVCHGVVRMEEDATTRQVVLSGTGEPLTDATQQEVIECWYDHFIGDGSHPYAILSRSLDRDGNVVHEALRSALRHDDDEGVN